VGDLHYKKSANYRRTNSRRNYDLATDLERKNNTTNIWGQTYPSVIPQGRFGDVFIRR